MPGRMIGRGTLTTLLFVCGLALGSAPTASAAPTWLTPVPLSDASRAAGEVDIAFDRQGTAIAVWSRSNGTNTVIQASVRPPGGAFSAPQNLSATGQNAGDPH